MLSGSNFRNSDAGGSILFFYLPDSTVFNFFNSVTGIGKNPGKIVSRYKVFKYNYFKIILLKEYVEKYIYFFFF